MNEQQEAAFLRGIAHTLWGDSWLGDEKTASATSTDPQKMPPPAAQAALREKLDKRQHWTGGTNSDGYPKVKIEGKSELASHVLLRMHGRALRPGQVLMHKDNNPLNLRLSNLEVGTQADNLKQMRDEGRDRPRGVKQEPDMKKQADELDRKFVGGIQQRFQLSPSVTQYQTQALAKRLGGISPVAAYQIANMQAGHLGIPIEHAVHQLAMQQGVKYPYHLGTAGRQPRRLLGDDLLSELTAPAAAPAAAPATGNLQPLAGAAPVRTAPAVPRPKLNTPAIPPPTPVPSGNIPPAIYPKPPTAAVASAVPSVPRPRPKLLQAAAKLAPHL